MNRLRSDATRKQRGAALIEFALVLPIVVGVTFLVIDFGRAFYTKNVCEQASREGARQMAVGIDTTTVRSNIDALLASAGVTGQAVFTAPASNLVKCQVSCNFNWILPGVVRYFASGKSATDSLRGGCVMYKEF